MKQEEYHPILLAPTKISRLLYNNNPIIHNIICIWKQATASDKVKPIFSALPIDRIPTFSQSGLAGGFSKRN